MRNDFWEDTRPRYTGPCGPEWPEPWVEMLPHGGQIALPQPDHTDSGFHWTAEELNDALVIAYELMEDVNPSHDGRAINHRIKRAEKRLQA